MDTSTTHWPQGIGVVKPNMDQTNISKHQPNVLERRTRPQKDQALNCPRCNSTNTKFCYYNNYSLTQPRYFCKTCRRYWTEGGSLRNVPVGGGSRKNKRSSSSVPATSSSSSPLPSKQVSDNHLVPPSLNFPLAQSASQNPKIHQGQDLNLAYPPTSSTTTHDHHHHHQNSIATSFLEVPYNHNNKISLSSHTQNPSSTTSTSAMEFLKTSTGLMSSFMAMPVNPDHSNTIFSTGFSNLAQEFKPSLSFGLDHYNDQSNHQGYNGNNNIHGVQESSAAIGERLLFPSEDLKQVSSTTTTTDLHHHPHDHHQFELNKGQGDNISNIGYNWNGMLGHGGSW